MTLVGGEGDDIRDNFLEEVPLTSNCENGQGLNGIAGMEGSCVSKDL